MKILIANRGEIAVRIQRAAAALQIPTVAVFSVEDAHSLHTRLAEECFALEAAGVAAYMDMDKIIHAAQLHHCTAIHPGYGFLAENAAFARRCEEADIVFIGPSSEILEQVGDKSKCRTLADRCGIPRLPGTDGPTSLEAAQSFLASLENSETVMVKALAGGGGRGIRPVQKLEDLEDAYRLCRSEALAAFGSEDVYVERQTHRARHIEVQIVGDGTGAVSHLWERECSIQRNHQKIVEVAPCPSLPDDLRQQLTAAAVRLTEAVRYRGLGTVEFLVEPGDDAAEPAFYFLEVNPRLQVEHTVTEEITGIDLVQLQIEIAAGKSLAELGALQSDIQLPRGHAMQLRINMETYDENKNIRPSGGTLQVFYPPLGPGVRVDTHGCPGDTVSPQFDSLLAKLVVHDRSTQYTNLVAKAYRALCEFQIAGVDTNISLLQNLLLHPDVAANRISTNFFAENLTLFLDGKNHRHKTLATSGGRGQSPAHDPTRAPSAESGGPENTIAVRAPMIGTVVEIEVSKGDSIYENQSVAVVEAMKMQHLLKSDISGIVRKIAVDPGDTLYEGQPILFVEPARVDTEDLISKHNADPDYIRPDLAEVRSRHQRGLDDARAEAVARRHQKGLRTARENIADLIDPDTFIEYGALAVAAQRRRRTIDDLIDNTPADGLIAGIGSINGDRFDAARARCMVLAYDFTVLAGTQGMFNHKKTDRMLALAEEWQLPLVLFAEGGGGRPGDVDAMDKAVAGLDLNTFTQYAKLSGLVPVVGIVSGRCFAGNATLLGCSDVIIATKNSNIGMGGPAMIEGGGLGKCRPEDIGPIEVQAPNGVVDVVAADEEEAVRVAKKYLSYFQGPVSQWGCEDQRLLRHFVPENRLRAYDVRKVIDVLADTDSVLELRRDYGVGIITSLVRIEGIPFGLAANNTLHLGGAIDAESADKVSRFLQLCDAFDLPLIVLADTPGFMVGPEAEKSAQVRRFARMFVTAAGATTPIFSVVLRKGYGLGAMAMVGGGFHRPVFNVAWPTGEFGGMGLEGAVRLGYRKELEAVEDPEEREKLYENLVAMAYEHGKGINMASFLEIDDVIDPMETRRWILQGARSLPPVPPRKGKKRPHIDTW